MKVTIEKADNVTNSKVAMTCPHCGHKGTFETIGVLDLGILSGGTKFSNYMGLRKCPNDNCKGQLFFIMDADKNLIYISPPETISFDKENVPDKILESFTQAIICHSHSCFIASAIMIRKTLEEICFDKGITGKDLKTKISSLGSRILIPRELLEGMDTLRLLGNDAAHIEAKTFNEIGKDEIEISIDFTKEIIKAIYQYDRLLEKLKSLKKVTNGIQQS